MIERVFISSKAHEQAKAHHIFPQLTKAVAKLKKGQNRGLDFKKRKPKSENIWSFRISKKYRAWAHREQGVLYVFAIDDHQ